MSAAAEPGGEPVPLSFRLLETAPGALQHFIVKFTPQTVAKVRSIAAAAAVQATAPAPATMPLAAVEPIGFVVEYDGLAGNLPKKYANSASLWEGSIPNTDADPLETVAATTNSQRGNITFTKTDIGPAPMCVTYQVGAEPSRMCALAQANSDGPPVPLYVSISIVEMTSASVTVMYSTLPGYLPMTNNNWLGIWLGYALPYRGPDPLARQTVTSDYTQGNIVLSTPLSKEFEYTLVYFMGPERTSAAALIYFQPTAMSAASTAAADAAPRPSPQNSTHQL